MPLQSVPAYSGFRTGRIGKAYNEVAFRHFLGVERRRAERSARSLLLVLVTVRQSLEPTAKLTDAMAGALFAGLGTFVREVDFVGWYRESHVVGAVLPQRGKASVEVQYRMTERMLHALKRRLSADQSRNLRVRVVRLGGRVRIS
jgi:hypothetical protein